MDEQSRTWKAYRTGDLVRYNADSSIRILGRADTQLKLRGKRVELGEIDMAIQRTGLVDQVVTDVVQRNGTTLLFSFITISPSDVPKMSEKEKVVLRQSQNPNQTIQCIRTSLQQDLPVYMQPWAIIKVDSIPRSSSGKVDRRLLQRTAETWSSENEEDSSAAPAALDIGALSQSEHTMQKLWLEVLGIERQEIASSGKRTSYTWRSPSDFMTDGNRYVRKTWRRLP